MRPVSLDIGGVIPDLELNFFGDDNDRTTLRPNVYVPLGAHYISGSGFSPALEFGYMHEFGNDDTDAFDLPWFGCKTGFRSDIRSEISDPSLPLEVQHHK